MEIEKLTLNHEYIIEEPALALAYLLAQRVIEQTGRHTIEFSKEELEALEANTGIQMILHIADYGGGMNELLKLEVVS